MPRWLCLSPCRMAIQVDKFDLESLPEPDEERLRFASPRQLEEERLQAQGCRISGDLGLVWSIISFAARVPCWGGGGGNGEGPEEWRGRGLSWLAARWVVQTSVLSVSVQLGGCQ